MATKRLKELLEARKSSVRENSGMNLSQLKHNSSFFPSPFTSIFSLFADLEIKNVA